MTFSGHSYPKTPEFYVFHFSELLPPLKHTQNTPETHPCYTHRCTAYVTPYVTPLKRSRNKALRRVFNTLKNTPYVTPFDTPMIHLHAHTHIPDFGLEKFLTSQQVNPLFTPFYSNRVFTVFHLFN